MAEPWEVQGWIECVYYVLHQYIPQCNAAKGGIRCPYEGKCIQAKLSPPRWFVVKEGKE